MVDVSTFFMGTGEDGQVVWEDSVETRSLTMRSAEVRGFKEGISVLAPGLVKDAPIPVPVRIVVNGKITDTVTLMMEGGDQVTCDLVEMGERRIARIHNRPTTPRDKKAIVDWWDAMHNPPPPPEPEPQEEEEVPKSEICGGGCSIV